MKKYLFLVLATIAGILAWMTFWLGSFSLSAEPVFVSPSPHYYKNPQESIKKIFIGALYFVPKNKEKNLAPNFAEILEKNLSELKEFHRVQFQGRSAIAYEIFLSPVIGREENIVYDTDITQHGNPQALLNISDELRSRLLLSGGDIAWDSFVKKNDDAFKVLLVLYEGVGASGIREFALLSRQFLTDTQYANYASSFLAHEFYHTLGLPDGYGEDASPYMADLMGSGRFLPLSRAYLNRALLKDLGL